MAGLNLSSGKTKINKIFYLAQLLDRNIIFKMSNTFSKILIDEVIPIFGHIII